MTALTKYQRLEASALWRATPQEQRRNVIISLGDSTLVVTDMQDRALAHWSLSALQRVNPGKFPAIFSPDEDIGETLEISDSETDMIEAIEKLRNAIAKRRPRPGRLRLVSVLTSVTAVCALAVFWLPTAMLEHTVKTVPDAKRHAIDSEILTQLYRLTGTPCSETNADIALLHLQERLGQHKLIVVPDGPPRALALPGGAMVLNRALIEDFAEPSVVAGYIIAENLRAQANDPLHSLLERGGPATSFGLLTRGTLDKGVLEDGAAHLLRAPAKDIAMDVLIAGFAEKRVSARPYAYAVDITGEATFPLIEADTMANAPDVILTDGHWVALQGICGN